MTLPGPVLVLFLGSVLGPLAPAEPGVPHASEVARQDGADVAARRVAELWERGDAAGLGEMLRPSGVSLDLGDRPHAALEVRQAVAAIRDLLGRHAAGSVRLDRVTDVAGAPPRAYVEIAWETVPKGTAETMRHTVFVGLELADARWWITEIRVLG